MALLLLENISIEYSIKDRTPQVSSFLSAFLTKTLSNAPLTWTAISLEVNFG
jgi:hypothetical protein